MKFLGLILAVTVISCSQPATNANQNQINDLVEKLAQEKAQNIVLQEKLKAQQKTEATSVVTATNKKNESEFKSPDRNKVLASISDEKIGGIDGACDFSRDCNEGYQCSETDNKCHPGKKGVDEWPSSDGN
jgi:predicted ATP-grasp superfamily ATP-dependent carboligase